jgi:hypothetical protein
MRTIFVLSLVAVLSCASPSAQELIGAQPTVTTTGARALVDACLAGGGGGDECARAAVAAVLENASTTLPSTRP